jgi:hypothetical protein
MMDPPIRERRDLVGVRASPAGQHKLVTQTVWFGPYGSGPGQKMGRGLAGLASVRSSATHPVCAVFFLQIQTKSKLGTKFSLIFNEILQWIFLQNLTSLRPSSRPALGGDASYISSSESRTTTSARGSVRWHHRPLAWRLHHAPVGGRVFRRGLRSVTLFFLYCIGLNIIFAFLLFFWNGCKSFAPIY